MISATMLALMAVGQVAFAGSQLDPRQAYAEANAVIVAEVTGCDTLLGLGAVWFASGLALEPSLALKGDPGKGPLKGLSMQGGSDERFTGLGEEHIFFIGEYKGKQKVLKVLPNSPENLAAIRAMGS